MPTTALIKPTHRAIQHYYQALQRYSEQRIAHEGALETAFQRLLADTARLRNWNLIPKLALKVNGTIYPDGTLRDEYNLPRGYWEAKDTDDHLDKEITKKIARRYPLTNTIFEDTREAVLIQGKREALPSRPTQHGGRARSGPKTVARANGTKSGRPRKRGRTSAARSRRD